MFLSTSSVNLWGFHLKNIYGPNIGWQQTLHHHLWFGYKDYYKQSTIIWQYKGTIKTKWLLIPSITASRGQLCAQDQKFHFIVIHTTYNKVVCHTVALPFTLKKYLKAKEELRKLKYNFQKSSKKNQNFFKLL